MAVLAVIVGAVVAFTTRRARPGLVAGLAVWALVTLYLTVGVRLFEDDSTGSDHSLTAGFWAAQIVLLLLTVGGTLLVARQRGGRSAVGA
ncbi:MAG: hypothetical protein Q8R60_19875 [Mycobacteriales bacterium]|nr:hypothetical protein [Mycobacteriales bacterium]